jgi:hypothetical protein
MSATKITRTDVCIAIIIVWLITMVVSFFIGGPREILRGSEAFGWQKYTARIVDTDYQQTDEDTAVLTVTVQYEFAGVPYRARRALTDTPDVLQHQAELFLKPGETVDCRVNPDAPEQIMLEKEYLLFDFFLYMGIFITVFLVLLCIGWCVWITWRQRTGAVKFSAFVQKTGIVLGCSFVLIFCGIATARGVMEAVQAFGMLGWQRTEATIQTCEITKVREGKSWNWQTELAYAYTFDGKLYAGHKWTLFEDDVSTKSQMRRAMRDMTPGDTVTCYVNPRDPAQAVLQRRLWSYYGLLLLFWGLAFCAWALWATLFGKKDADADTFRLSYEGDVDALEEGSQDADEEPVHITELPFHLQYELNRRQRLLPHLKLWKMTWPFVILVILVLPYILLEFWWLIFILPFAVWAVKGFFVGLIDVILHPRRPMDIIVDEENLFCLVNGEYRTLSLRRIIRMEKIHKHIWTVCFYDGQVVHIPDTVITDRQALHISLAGQTTEE